MDHTLPGLLAVVAPLTLAAACGTGNGTGTGGAASSSSATTTSSSATTTTSSSTTTTSSSSGTGGVAPTGACTDAADTQILAADDVPTLAANCAKMNLGEDPAIEACIQAGTGEDGGPGLSSACTQCFDAAVDCSIAHCPNQCLSDPSAAPCVACRAQSCDPAFYACSGLPQGSPDGG
jgi:hypothetical protein